MIADDLLKELTIAVAEGKGDYLVDVYEGECKVVVLLAPRVDGTRGGSKLAAKDVAIEVKQPAWDRDRGWYVP